RVLILANEKPPIFDRSEGIWNRLLLLIFRRSFFGQENRELPTLLTSELPGILNWALEGRERLYSVKQFTVPKVSADEKAQYKWESTPARSWLSDYWLKGDQNDYISFGGLYKQYAAFCKDNGFHALSRMTFNREVRRAFPHVTEKRKQILDERDRFWFG